MLFLPIVFCVLLAMAGPVEAQARPQVPALTLEEACRLAVKQSEEIARRVQAMGAAQGRIYQALGVILPKANYLMTRFEQDVNEDAGSSSSGTTSNAFRRTTPQQRITFSQPLFSGFKEFAVIQGAGAEKAQRYFEMQKAKETLFIDVAEAYYGVLQMRQEVQILRKVRAALIKKKKDLAKRVEIGRSKESEYLSASSDLALVEVDLIEAQRVYEWTRELLEFYIGRSLRESLGDDEKSLNEYAEPGDFALYSKQALTRPEVKASENAKTLAEKKVLAAQSGLWPKVSLDGNYYTKRVGFQNGNDWDVLLTVDVPVFNRLDTFGDIRVSASEKDSAVATHNETLRKAVFETKSAHRDYAAAYESHQKFLKVLEASRLEYEAYEKEYETNLVSSLDFLEALKKYQEMQIRYNQAYYQMKKSFWKFKVAIGEVKILRPSGSE